MKILFNLKDNKVDFVLEVLKNFKFVKTEPLIPHKAEVLKGIKDGIDEMNLIREGKLKGIPAKDLLDEL